MEQPVKRVSAYEKILFSRRWFRLSGKLPRGVRHFLSASFSATYKKSTDQSFVIEAKNITLTAFRFPQYVFSPILEVSITEKILFS
jgi:hypothetical protein